MEPLGEGAWRPFRGRSLGPLREELRAFGEELWDLWLYPRPTFFPLLFLGHLEVLKLLVARGADLSCKDRKGYGLLHTAAASGQIEVVKYLLRMGAEVRAVNSVSRCSGQGIGSQNLL